MGTWATLKDSAILVVKEYTPTGLVLTLIYEEAIPEALEWSMSYIQAQEKFARNMAGLARDAFQSAWDAGAKATILAGEILTDIAGDTVEILEDWFLDYLKPHGLFLPDVPSGWNPFGNDDDEALFIYTSIDLYYRDPEDSPTYTPDEGFSQHFYHGQSYFLPVYNPSSMSDGSLLIYFELGGETLDGGNCLLRRCHPGFLTALQNIPMDLLLQLRYYGGWPVTIMGTNIYLLFDGESSHPNYTDPPGDDPTSCFYAGTLPGEDHYYLAVTDEDDNYCVNYAMRTYATSVTLWKRAFWWSYLMSSELDAPFSVIQSGGYLGADDAELRFGGKLLTDDPIIYDGPHNFKATSQPVVLMSLLNGFLGPHLKKKDENNGFGEHSATYNNETMIYNGETMTYD